MDVFAVGRLYDSYFSMGDFFPVFHPYVCGAILDCFSDKLLPLEFEGVVLVLQRIVLATFSDNSGIQRVKEVLEKAKKFFISDVKNNKIKILNKIPFKV